MPTIPAVTNASAGKTNAADASASAITHGYEVDDGWENVKSLDDRGDDPTAGAGARCNHPWHADHQRNSNGMLKVSHFGPEVVVAQLETMVANKEDHEVIVQPGGGGGLHRIL
jgi:hypothetical protein